MNYFSLFLLFFLATQFNLLKQRIQGIVTKENLKNFDKISQSIKDCFDDYDQLIHYVDEDNGLYSSVYLVCVVINVASTCACLYLFAQVKNEIFIEIFGDFLFAIFILFRFPMTFTL